MAAAAIGAGAWFLIAGNDEGSTSADTTDAPATSGRVEAGVQSTPVSTAPTSPPSTAPSSTAALPAGQTVTLTEQIGTGTIAADATVDGRQFAGLTALTNSPSATTGGGMLAISDAHVGPYEATMFEFEVDVQDGRVSAAGASPISLVDGDGQVLSGEELDVEGMAVIDEDAILVASEGSAADQLDPALHEFDQQGRLRRDWIVPEWFHPSESSGIPLEGGLNSLAQLSEDQVVAGFEYTLRQDAPATEDEPDSARILVYDRASREPVTEYRYPIDATTFDWPASDGSLVKSGLLELLPVGDGRTVLALERSLREEPITTRLYEVVLDPAKGATPSLEGPTEMLEKRELVRFEVGGGFESMAFGDPLPGSRRTLIVLSDHGFQGRTTVMVAYALTVERAE